MFSTVPTARELFSVDQLPERSRSYAHDTVTLGWEDRMKARARRKTDRGFEFATVLPRGRLLHEGDCFVFDMESLIVHVGERAEPVLVVRPETSREWALFAYHIGNSHQPVMLLDDAIVCADLPGMEQVLAYHGIPFSRAVRSFTPVNLGMDHRHQIST